MSAGHAERTRIRFEQDAFSWLGGRALDALDALDAIEALELLACLRRVTARGVIEMAHCLKDRFKLLYIARKARPALLGPERWPA